MRSAPERGAGESRPDGRFARLRAARRVWAIAVIHGEARHLAEHVVGVGDAGDSHADLASLRVKKSTNLFFCSLPVVVSGKSVSFTNTNRRGTL